MTIYTAEHAKRLSANADAVSDDLTPETVQQWVDHLRTMEDDPEHAHSFEDMIRGRVLSAIAAGRCSDPAECARIVLTTAEIDFERWYA